MPSHITNPGDAEKKRYSCHRVDCVTLDSAHHRLAPKCYRASPCHPQGYAKFSVLHSTRFIPHGRDRATCQQWLFSKLHTHKRQRETEVPLIIIIIGEQFDCDKTLQKQNRDTVGEFLVFPTVDNPDETTRSQCFPLALRVLLYSEQLNSYLGCYRYPLLPKSTLKHARYVHYVHRNHFHIYLQNHIFKCKKMSIKN